MFFKATVYILYTYNVYALIKMLIYSVTYIISIRVLIVSLYQIQRMKIMRWEEMSAQYINKG